MQASICRLGIYRLERYRLEIYRLESDRLENRPSLRRSRLGLQHGWK